LVEAASLLTLRREAWKSALSEVGESRVDLLGGWGEAPAVVLSCPGPLRRQEAALLPVADLVLPQVLLGCESQLLAFAAAATDLAGRLYFAPMPEMFPGIAGLRACVRALAENSAARIGPRTVHLRFGSVRSARVLKGIRNAAVIAEAESPPPLTASHHPFASGRTLPAAMRRLVLYRDDAARPRPIGGGVLPATTLPPGFVDADLARRPQAAGEPEQALDLACLLDFRSAAWAAGRVGPRAPRARFAAAASTVLLPWNMDHPGSIVPALLERLLQLRLTSPAVPRIVLLPFNYIGQTGIIRRLAARLRHAADHPEAALADIYLARVTSLDAIPALRGVSRVAWVDGNDPEHWWSLARLAACGIDPILIDPAESRAAGVARLAADEAIWVEGETRCGALTFAARLPSPRALPGLLAMTASRQDATRSAATRRRSGRRMELAQ
jgi:hypothetical protein